MVMQLEPRLFKCLICDKLFTRMDSTTDHIRGIHGIGKPFRCHCGAEFQSRGACRMHRKVCVEWSVL